MLYFIPCAIEEYEPTVLSTKGLSRNTIGLLRCVLSDMFAIDSVMKFSG
jgi:hypothetical protein